MVDASPRAAVVLTHNSAPVIQRCLDAIKHAAPDWQLVVADNASSDETLSMVRQGSPDAQIIAHEANLGYSGGYNETLATLADLGVRHAALINPDVVVNPGALDVLSSALYKTPDAIIAAPTIFTADNTTVESAGGCMDWRTGRPKYRKAPGQAPIEEVDVASGACMVLDVPSFDALGGFDEKYFLYWEEVEFCTRALKANRTVVHVPEATVAHDKGTSSSNATSPLTTYYYTRNGLLFQEQHGGEDAARLQDIFIANQRTYHLTNNSPELPQELAAVEHGISDYAHRRFGYRSPDSL
jgi:GT2 family glycosyltransferase